MRKSVSLMYPENFTVKKYCSHYNAQCYPRTHGARHCVAVGKRHECRMSGRIISWSEDYYTLDTKAEGYVHKIDEMVLIPAEEDARHYVMNRLDRAKPEDLDGLFHDDSLTPPGDPYQMYISYAQDYFNKYYLETWTYEAGGDRHEYTVHDYEQAIVDGTFNGKTIEEISRNYMNDGSPAEDRAARAYTGDLCNIRKNFSTEFISTW